MLAKQICAALVLLGLNAEGCAAAAESPPLFVVVPAPAVAADSSGPVAGDVNGDRKPDLVVPAGRRLHVLLGDGRGGFNPAQRAPAALPDHGSEAVLADMNGDGRPDAVLADHDSYDATVLLGDGAGGFFPARGSPFPARRGTRPHTHGLAVGDFNNDRKPDVVTANNADGDIALLLGDGTGALAAAPRSPFPCGPKPYPIAVSDLNGDGNLDVLVPNSLPEDSNVRTLTVLRGDGRGALSAAPGSPVALAGPAFFATAGDVNSDGKPDVIVTHNDDDGATILLNDGRGNLSPAPSSPLKLGHSCWGVQVLDMNGDGKPDLLLAGGDSVRAFLGDGRANFKPAPRSPYVVGKGTWRFSVADFNGDGKPDLLVKCVEENRLGMLMGK